MFCCCYCCGIRGDCIDRYSLTEKPRDDCGDVSKGQPWGIMYLFTRSLTHLLRLKWSGYLP